MQHKQKVIKGRKQLTYLPPLVYLQIRNNEKSIRNYLHCVYTDFYNSGSS